MATLAAQGNRSSGGKVRVSAQGDIFPSSSPSSSVPLETRTRGGFTLIELLVVIAIIAILAAMLLPGLSRAKMQSQSTLCTANEKQLTMAWLSYTSDNRGYLAPNGGAYVFGFPSWVYSDPSVTATPPLLYTANITNGVLYPYVGNPKVYVCPTETAVVSWGGQPDELGPYVTGVINRDYAISAQLGVYRLNSATPTAGGDEIGGYSPSCLKETDIQHPPPARAFVFIHEADLTITNGAGFFWFGMNAAALFYDSFEHEGWSVVPSTIHLKGDNLSFADGHVEHWTWYEQSTLNITNYNYTYITFPTDRDFDRLAAAYSTPLTGGGQY